MSLCELFSVSIKNPPYDNDRIAVLDLPAIYGGIQRAVETVDAASVEECTFRCVDCLIPSLRDAINDVLEDGGLEQVVDFAGKLAHLERVWGEAEFVRYKALLAAAGQPDLDAATRMMERPNSTSCEVMLPRPGTMRSWSSGRSTPIAGGAIPDAPGGADGPENVG